MLTFRSVRIGAVGPIDLTVEAGQCVGITGPSGIGKTRLLRAAADMEPFEGTVQLGETSSAALSGPAWRRRVGLLPAESAWWHDRVRDHFPTTDGLPLDRLGIDPKAVDWAVSRLSSGERQRLAILRLLANKPRALLLDEPTASLDADNIHRAEALIADYRENERVPVVWVGHDPVQLRRVASRSYLMGPDGLFPL